MFSKLEENKGLDFNTNKWKSSLCKIEEDLWSTHLWFAICLHGRKPSWSVCLGWKDLDAGCCLSDQCLISGLIAVRQDNRGFWIVLRTLQDTCGWKERRSLWGVHWAVDVDVWLDGAVVCDSEEFEFCDVVCWEGFPTKIKQTKNQGQY